MRSKISIPIFTTFLFVGMGSAQDAAATTMPPNFVGYGIYPNGATETGYCDYESQTAFRSSTFATCCLPNTGCNFATACKDGTATRVFGGTYTCSSSWPFCYSWTFYNTFPATSATQSWIEVGCGNSRALELTVFYLQTAAATTTSSSRPTSTSSRSLPVETGSSSSQSASAAPASTTSAAPASGSGSGSKAWIAGAVVGPVVAIVLVAAIAFWLGKRRSSRSGGSVPVQNMPGPNNNGPPQPQVSQPYYFPGPQQQQQQQPPHHPHHSYLGQSYDPASPAPTDGAWTKQTNAASSTVTEFQHVPNASTPPVAGPGMGYATYQGDGPYPAPGVQAYNYNPVGVNELPSYSEPRH